MKSIKGNIKPTIIDLSSEGFRKDGGQYIKADGNFHDFIGDEYVDERAIDFEGDRTIIETDKIRGKIAYKVEYIVSPDGLKLTWHIANYTNPNGQAVRSEIVQRRVGQMVAGAHPIAGKWERESVYVDAKSDWILKLDRSKFSWRTEEGTGYDAFVGGASVKIDGDNSGARAQITRPRSDTVVETDFSAHGERQVIMRMRLTPDAATLSCIAFYLKSGKSTKFVLHRVAD